MGSMKSAFERAWERAEKLGKLTEEEVREHKRQEFAPIGQGIAQRYLEHGHADLLREGVGRYDGEEREIVTGGALSSLVAAVEIGNYDIATRAMAGISTLKGNGMLQEIAEKLRAIYQEYEQAKQQKSEKESERLQREEREILHRLRISGSAIDEINLEGSSLWEMLCAELRSQFDARVSQLKEELAHILGIEQA